MKRIGQLIALILAFAMLCSVSYAAEEVCNFIDDDGDGEIDEGLGRGDPCTVGVGECEAEGYIICAENEIDAICNAEPGDPSDEVCDQKDNDCDGEIDEGVCVQEELCNGIDDDNDGYIDEDFKIGYPCYVGRGECRVNGTFICDENDETDNICNATPGAPSAEICDQKDNDCDGEIDEGLSITYYKDEDGDGYGGPNKKSTTPCDAILRIEVLTPSDCDDANSSIHPGANDECDGVDNDCDGEIDEDCIQPRQPVEWVVRPLPEELNDTGVQNDTGAQNDTANDTGQPSAVTSVFNSIGNAVGNFFGFLGGLFRNKCKGVVCQPSTKACPDGSEARCNNKCRRGKCSSCDPVCPVIPLVSDTDGDGIADDSDQCPQKAGLAFNKGCPFNPMVMHPSDPDSDGVTDNADLCPQDAGPAKNRGCQFILRTSRPDSDSDGVIDDADQCPTEAGFVTNEGCPSTDTDGDGFDDNNDYCPNVQGTLSTIKSQSNGCPSTTDTDGDGIADDSDQCPQNIGLAFNKGCPFNPMVMHPSDPDSDGVTDNADLCPQHPGPAKNRGCAFIPLQIKHLDSDNDGTIDDADQCPTEAGFVTNEGCPSTDTDGDGFDDNNDYCPNVQGTLSTIKSQSNGCPSVTDTDGDGIANDADQCPQDKGLAIDRGCPSTANRTSPSDADGDGVDDNADLCPQHPGPAKNRGCSFIPLQIKHLDSDNDGTIDDADQCPTEAGPVINSGCNDQDPNTQDSCDPRTGACEHTLSPGLNGYIEPCNLSIEGAVVNKLSRNIELFVNNDGGDDLGLSAYFSLRSDPSPYAWFSNAKANAVTKVTIPEANTIFDANPWKNIEDIATIIISSPDCSNVEDSVDRSWILKKSQYCRYADASIVGARYDDMGELVLTVNNSGDVDLGFSAYIEYVNNPSPFIWAFNVGENTVANEVMSEIYRNFEEGGEVSRVVITELECSIGEYSFGRADIARIT